MKRDATVLASFLLLLGTAFLLLMAGDFMTEEKTQALGATMLQRQLGSVAALAQVTAEAAPVVPTASAPAEENVPVTTVEEAWDEIARETESVTTTPSPVTVEGVGTLELRNETGYSVDLTELPSLPALDTLQAGQPMVLIMHTHGSESYGEQSSSGYRSQDESLNVIAIGETIRQVLEARGYSVYHDKTLCDYPEYTGAYSRSREVIRQALERYPGIFLVLDIHRDAVEDGNGNQLRMACTLEGEDCAQLMLVVGTDAGGNVHPSWQTNLSLAAVLQLRLDALCPGLMRPLNLRTERFNQDLAPLTLLVEVGASGNTLSEAKLAAKTFAETLSGVLDDCGGKSS